jgi:hypothetical protein
MSRASSSETEAFLHSHGISVHSRELEAMLEEAVSRLPRTLYRPDPRAELTEPELDILVKGGFPVGPRDLGTEDPLARTTAEYAALLKSSLTTGELARRLGVDQSRIRQRLGAKPPTIYGIRLETGWVLPEFQLEEDCLLPGLGEVVSSLDPDLHPVAVFRWFTTPNPDLIAEGPGDGRAVSPRDWLRAGLPVRVVAELAAAL